MLRVDDTSHNFHHYWRNIRLIPHAVWDAVEDRAFLGGIALYPRNFKFAATAISCHLFIPGITTSPIESPPIE